MMKIIMYKTYSKQSNNKKFNFSTEQAKAYQNHQLAEQCLNFKSVLQEFTKISKTIMPLVC